MKNIITSSILFASASLAFGAFDASTGIADGNSIITGEQTITTKLTVTNGSLLSVGTASTKGVLNVEYGGDPIKNSGTIVVAEKSDLVVKNTAAKGWSTAYENVGNIDVYGSAVFNTSKPGEAYVKISNSTVNVYAGGNLKSNSILWIEKNGLIHLQNSAQADFSDMYIAQGTLKIDDNIQFGTYYQKRIIASGTGYIATVDASDAKSVSLYEFVYTNSHFDIKLSQDLFSIAKLTKTKGSDNDLILTDFRNDTFQIRDNSNLVINGETFTLSYNNTTSVVNLYAADIDGNIITLAEDQYWYFTDDGFLNIANFGNVAVPEPAQWAVIFGALALGLAIYRKRK